MLNTNGNLTSDQLAMLSDENGKCWLEERDKREVVEAMAARLEMKLTAIRVLVEQSDELAMWELRMALDRIGKLAEI